MYYKKIYIHYATSKYCPFKYNNIKLLKHALDLPCTNT